LNANQKGLRMESMETNHYGTRGIVSTTMPIPPIAENCFEIPAGPVKFVLESRLLNAEVISDHEAKYGSNLGANLEEDGGASLHVYGALDGLEYLRFDCFEKQPHYHYVRQTEQLNQVLMIDDIAVDPIQWTLICVKHRLAEMLEYAGASDLGAAVRNHSAEVATGFAQVVETIGKMSGRSPELA
jgi:hypothetical protein